MQGQQSSRKVSRWFEALDHPQAFRPRPFLIVWVPLGLVALIAESPRGTAQHWGWLGAVIVATLIATAFLVACGRLVARFSSSLTRGIATPVVYAGAGLVRGLTAGVLADHFALLERNLWSVRTLGNALASVVLVSAISIIDRESSRVVRLQRGARHLSRARRALEQAPTPADLFATWLTVVREAIDDHFAEQPWTQRARSLAQRRGREQLMTLITRRLSEARTLDSSAKDPWRERRAESTHFSRLIELSTVNLTALRVSTPVVMGLTVIPVLSPLPGFAEYTLDGMATEAVAVLSAVVVSALFTFGLARWFGPLVRRARLWLRFTALTVALFFGGVVTAVGVTVVDIVLLEAAHISSPMLYISIAPVVSILMGWASLAIAGLDAYATLLSRENDRAQHQLTATLRATEHERSLLGSTPRLSSSSRPLWRPLSRQPLGQAVQVGTVRARTTPSRAQSPFSNGR